MPFIFIAMTIDGWQVSPDAPGFYIAFAIVAVWVIFIGWRGVRTVRALALKRDRKFDREGKFALPPEYGNTHSVTEARRRRR